MAQDTTEHNTTANDLLAGWVRLDSDPQELPPIEGQTFGGLTQGDDSRYPLPVQWGARAFDVPVGAPIVYRAMIDRLEQWQNKGFAQPVNAGARWHLQLRHVEEVPGQAPGVSSVVLRGFQIMIPPGEDTPIVYTFSTGEQEVPDFLLPGVSVKVTQRHDRRCDLVIEWTSAAGAVVGDDLMDRARDLWGELGGLEERAEDGLKPIPPGPLKERREKVRQMYLAGMAIKDIARIGLEQMDTFTVENDVKWLIKYGYMKKRNKPY